MSESTPIAVIQQGTTKTQKVLTGNLVNMPDLVASNQIKAPTIIIVGQVVKLREQLAWFENQTD